MPWLIEAALPVKFDDRCAVCNRDAAVTAATMEHQNVVGFVGVAWIVEDLRIQVPCCARCDRRFRRLRRAFWGFFLVPWVVLTVLSLVGPDELGNHAIALVSAATAFMAVGYSFFVWRWWLMRSVRIVRTDSARAIIAVRNKAYAERLGGLNGAVPQRALWTG